MSANNFYLVSRVLRHEHGLSSADSRSWGSARGSVGAVLAGLILAHALLPNAGVAEDDPAIAAVSGPAIVWRVENPFRFFNEPADTEVHRATYLSLSEAERKAPVLSAERSLSQRHPDGWAATMVQKVCWKSESNRHFCPDDSAYINPESHRIIAALTGIEDAEVLDCTWRIKARGGRPLGTAPVTQLCRDDIVFDVPYPGGAEITVEIGGRSIASSDVRVTDLLIAAMGDSYGSGEGNPDLPVRFSRERAADYGVGDLSGYPARIGAWGAIGDKKFIAENARWLDQACHRSLYSHQTRAALQLALEDPHRTVTFVGVACAGAEVTAGLFLRYTGNEWVPNPPDLSQISYIAQAQCGATEAPQEDLPEAYHMRGRVPDLKGGLVLRKCPAEKARKIDLVFLSVGGNDIGFSRLVANAVLADASLLKKLGGWFGNTITRTEIESKLDGLGDRYKALNRAVHTILHVPWKESDRIILTAYPGLALLGDGTALCPDGAAGMEVLADFAMSAEKVREGVLVADKFHRTMQTSAEAYGWTFVDAHRRAFIGRGVCAGFTQNAFSSADDLRLPRFKNGVWHPYNPADYKAYTTRQRWVRTPNDAFMTGNFHVPRTLLDKVLKLESLSWVQVLLASTYSGAFHPTAEGHAAMADAVADKARKVLAKYSRTEGVSPPAVAVGVLPVATEDLPDLTSAPAPSLIEAAPVDETSPADPPADAGQEKTEVLGEPLAEPREQAVAPDSIVPFLEPVAPDSLKE